MRAAERVTPPLIPSAPRDLFGGDSSRRLNASTVRSRSRRSPFRSRRYLREMSSRPHVPRDTVGSLTAPPRTPRGRKTKCTRAVREKVCEQIRIGNYLIVALAVAGIPSGTGFRWFREGKKKDAPRAWRLFRHAVRRAKLEREAKLVALVVAGGAVKDPRVALEYLSRIVPSRYGRGRDVQRTELAGSVGVRGLSDALEAVLESEGPSGGSGEGGDSAV